MTSPTPSLIERIKAALARLLGSHYLAVMTLLGRVLGVFVAAVATKALSMGISIPGISSLAWWHAVLGAGVAAVIVLAQSLLTQFVTGWPGLMVFTSSTVRSLRTQARVTTRLRVRRPR